jgi:hypothetical protein
MRPPVQATLLVVVCQWLNGLTAELEQVSSSPSLNHKRATKIVTVSLKVPVVAGASQESKLEEPWQLGYPGWQRQRTQA